MIDPASLAALSAISSSSEKGFVLTASIATLP
jgi:hypothetical protein